MKYTKEFSEGFQPWSGAVSTYDRIIEEKGLDALENALEQIFEGGEEPPTETQINDLLWFEPETVYKLLGMKPDNTHERTLAEILEAWQDDNERFGYKGIRAEIVDYETVRITYTDPEEVEEGETPEEQTEDLNAEEVAGLFGDDCGEIDEDAQTVETWEED